MTAAAQQSTSQDPSKNLGKSLGRGVAWTTFGTIADRVLIFLNVFIILQHLSVYEYGLTELVFSAFSTVGIIMLPGLSTTIIADMGVERGHGDHSKMKAIFFQYSILMLILSVVAFCILFFGASEVARLSGNASIGYFLRIVSFSLLISPFRAIALLMATVHVRFIDQAAYSIVEEAAKTVALVVFFFVLSRGPDGLLYAFVLSQLAAVLVFLPRTISGYMHFSHAPASGQHRFWEMLGTHRKWSILASYVGTITQNMQLWIIKVMLGTTAVGLFAFASGILSNVSSLLPLTSVLTSLGPRYVEKKEQFMHLIKTSVKVQFLVSLGLFIIAMIGLPVVLFLLPKYKPSAWLVVVMMLVLIPTSVSAIFTPIFATLKEQFQFFISTNIKFFFTLVLFPLSIFGFGILGVGVASILVNLLSGVERYLRLKRILPNFVLKAQDFFIITRQEISFLIQLPMRMFSRKAVMMLLESDSGL